MDVMQPKLKNRSELPAGEKTILDQSKTDQN